MGKSAPGHSDDPAWSVLHNAISVVLATFLVSALLVLGGCNILARGDFIGEMDSFLTGNTPPDADAGVDFSVVTGNMATLDGGGSSDADSDALSFTWYFIALPAGSLLTDASIIDRFTSTPDFVPDIDGTYTLELQVDDGESIDSDTIDITASATNNPPVADAGANQNVFTGAIAVLDGSASFDPDGDPLSYSWTFTSTPAGSSLMDVDIVGVNTFNPSFTTDLPGDYVLEFTVDDGMDFTLDTVTVTAITANNPPIADAGTDQAGFENTTFILDGSGSSDADLDPLTYTWNFTFIPGGSILTDGDITGRTTTAPSFIPDAPGNFQLELTVDDGTDTNTDIVVVTSNAAELVGEWLFNSASAVDTSPYANDGIPDSTAIPAADRAGNPVHAYSFDGTNTATIFYGNDPTLDFTDAISVVCWVRPDDIAGEGRILSKRNSVPASGWELYIGDDAGTTTMYFMGNGGVIGDAPMAGTLNGDWAHIAVTWCPGDPAGQLKFYYNGSPVGTVTTAVTMFSSTTGLYMGRPGYASVLNFLGAIDDTRLYHGILSAGDISALYAEIPPNTPPTADAGPDANAFENTTVVLDGTGSSDPNPADTIDFFWSFTAVPGGSVLVDGDITGINTATPSFVPDVPGNFQLELIVDDGTDTNTDTVIVTSNATELVGEWLFSGGSLNDTSGFGSTGTANVAIPTLDRAGNSDAAYFFDGISANIVLGNGAQLNYTDMMSFSCWFRADDIDIDYGRIVSKRESVPAAGWELNVGTGDTITTNRAGVQNASNNSPGIFQGVWHHLVFTWDPHAPVEQIKFYLDGALLAGTGQFGGSADEPPVSAMPLTLGTAAYAPVSQFFGAIDDVRFYHGILLQDDVTALASEIPVP